jgi:alanine-synthesizing transaminase
MELLEQIPGVSCVKPKGAIYLFPKLDPTVYRIEDDIALVLDILDREKILLVQGSAFNIQDTYHFRMVFLPREDEMSKALGRIGNALEHYRLD